MRTADATPFRVTAIWFASIITTFVMISGCPPMTGPIDNSNGNDNAANSNSSANTNQNTNVNRNENTSASARISQDCAQCHANVVQRYTTGYHKSFENECLVCHDNGRDHMANPTQVPAKLNFALSACSGCHGTQYDTYLHDDASKPGHYGGSIATSKYDEYPHYQYLMGGHGFTLEYNEERAHGYMLKDHIDTARRQTTTCLQCKSTPVTFYWNERHRGAVQFSKEQAWATVVDRIEAEHPETIDYGAGCTHCHNPHDGSFRVIRKGVISAILERGTDPYSRLHNVIPENETALQALMNERGDDGELTERARRLAGTLTCAQCHIEYVCGQGADRATTGEIRDDVPWRKLRDIEDYYQSKFGLQQDWRHSVTGLTGIKPQHPETESYWNSSHHMLGMSCADCHMAKTTDVSGKAVASHWLTSPLKNNVQMCGDCHNDVQAELFAMQDDFYAKARRIEDALNAILLKIADPATAGAIPAADLASAKSLYMRALTWWEWTAVSENSMGAHNADEMESQLERAEQLANEADALLP